MLYILKRVQETHKGLEVQHNIYNLGEGGAGDSNSIRQEFSPDVWVKVIHANQSDPETCKLPVSCWARPVSVCMQSPHASHLMNTLMSTKTPC